MKQHNLWIPEPVVLPLFFLAQTGRSLIAFRASNSLAFAHVGFSGCKLAYGLGVEYSDGSQDWVMVYSPTPEALSESELQFLWEWATLTMPIDDSRCLCVWEFYPSDKWEELNEGD